ncbi:hypothetical protein [Melittangium boletus]|uniref:Lipoprotein n=1 Tax=Melittangium boletus DSM 14713 TaxID=1294270 RepID=A0A250IRK3_9BACT|nr:hypothetical protein [Melittangium boletus]ATB33880.1 hypothetical protein MEBOL_007381 [Melittangium boletus DSM 14713]
MKTPWPLLLVALGACEPQSLPSREPRILSVTPLSQRSDESRVVIVQLDEDPLFLVDYGQPSARLVQLPQLKLGNSVSVPLDTYLGHGQYQGRVGPISYGDYGIQVSLGDGREASFAESTYVVKRAVSYSFNSIGARRVNESFDITLHVDVKDDLPFSGMAWLQLYKTGVEYGAPLSIGPLTEGENSWPLTVLDPGDDYVVRITDDQGNDATSQTFPVDPEN